MVTLRFVTAGLIFLISRLWAMESYFGFVFRGFAGILGTSST